MESFFLEEYKRAFRAAEQSDKPFVILECLEEIGLVEDSRMKYKDDIIRLLSGYLSHTNNAIRYKAIWLMGDWITKDTSGRYPYVVSIIQDALSDKNWRIRYIAKTTLLDMGQVPTWYSVRIMDKIRVAIFNPDTIE